MDHQILIEGRQLAEMSIFCHKLMEGKGTRIKSYAFPKKLMNDIFT